MNILVAEDDNNLRELIGVLLQSLGHNVVCLAENGQAGIEAITKYNQDLQLVLTDLRMPIKNGIEVARFVKLNYPQIKVVVVSGEKDTDSVSQAAGADGFLRKPFFEEDLERIIRSITGVTA